MRRLVLITCLCCPVLASGHSGHSHGAETPRAPAEAEPRFAGSTDHVTLVGILKSDRLWLYADDPASNAPLDGLKIDVDTGIDTGAGAEVAHAASPGTGSYLLPAGKLTLPGTHTLVITVTGDGYTDLLTRTLSVPAAAGNTAADGSGETAPPVWDKALLPLLAGGLLLYLGWRQARASTRNFPVAVGLASAGLCTLALSSAYLLYASTSVAATVPGMRTQTATGDADAAEQPDTRPRRLPDGAAFIPKPAQTLLQVRTLPARQQRMARHVMLSGRIIHDPQSTVVVQAEQTGRLTPPAQGFPQPGAHVKRGDVLAHLHPVVSSLDGARQRAELAALEKDLYLNQRQVKRTREQLGEQDTTASVALDILRAEDAALQRRIELLRTALTAKLPMTAPIDGVIGESKAVNGAVIPAGGQVYSIVDPTRFWMQALAAADLDTRQISRAQALLHDGRSFPLSFAGHGYQLSNQALPLQFSPLAAMPALMVGTLLDIRLQTHETVEGVSLPRTSVLPSPGDGGAIVWVRTGAEHFEARRVEIQPIDEHTVLAVQGLRTGDRVVDNGSMLLSMIQSMAP